MKETLEGKLKADGYDEAIMGVVQRACQEPVILYDTDKVLEILISRDEMTEDEAIEFFEFNIVGAWVGEQTPAFFSKTSLEDIEDGLIRYKGSRYRL